jgi:hypothetical protein
MKLIFGFSMHSGPVARLFVLWPHGLTPVGPIGPRSGTGPGQPMASMNSADVIGWENIG